jgi:hypothetical protein
MKQRWLIRAVSVSLLALCVVAWVVSTITGYEIAQSATWLVIAEKGNFCFVATTASVHFDFSACKTDGTWLTYYEMLGGREWAGFRCGHTVDFHTDIGWLGFPFWFPTLLSAVLFWLVWQKTRPKYNVSGFPVEVAEKGATKP